MDSETFEELGLLPILCYRREPTGWRFNSLPERSRKITIGNGLQCDIIINELEGSDVQAILFLTASKWYIIETGEHSLLEVNGFKKRQGVITPFSSEYIIIGNTRMVFTVGKQKPVIPIPSFDSEGTFAPDNHFATISNLELANKCFPTDRTVLIGANPLCDIRVAGENFIGVISLFRNRLYLYSPTDTSSVTVDGEELVNSTKLLRHNCSILFNNETEITIKLDQELGNKPAFHQVPSSLAIPNLALLEIKQDGTTGELFLLPAPGRSINVGRSPKNYLVLDSKKVSREHAKIFIKPTSLLIVDNKAPNGTFLDGDRVNRREAIPGQLLRFADKRYLICYSD